MSPPESAPQPLRQYHIPQDETGCFSLEYHSAEMEQAVRRSLQLPTRKDLDGDIICLNLTVDLHPLPMLQSLGEVV